MDEARILVTARYVMPMPGQVLEKHYVVIEGDRVVGIDRFRGVDSTSIVDFYDLGDAVIMPGFINAHSRLDLCHLAGRVPYTGSFTAWLQTLVASRNAATPNDVEAAIRKGLQQAIHGGTTAIGDVAFAGNTVGPITECGLRGVVFFEAFGFDPELADTETTRIENLLETAMEYEISPANTDGDTEHSPIVQIGLAAHAPYCVSEALYRNIMRVMHERGDRFCTQLSETIDERKLIQVFEGEFVPFLESIFPEGVPALPAAASPVTYMADLLKDTRPAPTLGTPTSAIRQPRQPMFVHCNFLDDDDIAAIDNLHAAVVFCPRHHAFFDRPAHPVAQLLDNGQTVALGTCSLVTNDSLSMLDEVRFLARSPLHATIEPNEILRMATTHGARALGIEDEVGLLAPGMKADLIAVAIPHDTPDERVTDAVLTGMGPVTFTMVAGRPIYHEA